MRQLGTTHTPRPRRLVGVVFFFLGFVARFGQPLATQWSRQEKHLKIRTMDSNEEGEELEEELELGGALPRSVSLPGYVAPVELKTWRPFQYSSPPMRRRFVDDYMRTRAHSLPPLPGLKVCLIGGVASGKGTIAPMLSHAFACRVIGVGQLLRGEILAQRPRGLRALSKMKEGELLEDELVLDLLRDRLTRGSWETERNGWLLDGFPRTLSQAEALVQTGDGSSSRGAAPAGATRTDGAGELLLPDAVVFIERPDELVKEFSLGR